MGDHGALFCIQEYWVYHHPIAKCRVFCWCQVPPMWWPFQTGFLTSCTSVQLSWQIGCLSPLQHFGQQYMHLSKRTMCVSSLQWRQPKGRGSNLSSRLKVQMERRWLWYICLHIPFCFVWAVICHLLVMNIVSSVHTITIIGASSEEQGVIFLVSSMVSSVWLGITWSLYCRIYMLLENKHLH